MENRVACLVIAASAPKVLARAIEIYQQANWNIFVHLDAKVDIDKYAQEMGEFTSLLKFVDTRVNIFWGGYSMMEAEFSLLRSSMRSGQHDQFVLVSDDTMPILPPTILQSKCAIKADRITLTHQSPETEFSKRYRRPYFFDHPSLNPRGSRWPEIDAAAVSAVNAAYSLMTIGKKAIEVYHGSQWWMLTESTVKSILSLIESDPHLCASFKYSALPDEIMLQSIIGSYFPPERAVRGPVYADFSVQFGPKVYQSIDDLPQTIDPDVLLLRKFAANGEAAEDVRKTLMAGECLYDDNGRLHV